MNEDVSPINHGDFPASHASFRAYITSRVENILESLPILSVRKGYTWVFERSWKTLEN